MHAALNTLLVLSAVGNEGKKGVIIVVHHTGKFGSTSERKVRREIG